MHGRHLEASFSEQYLQYNERSSKIGEPIRSWFSYTDRSLPKAGIARVYIRCTTEENAMGGGDACNGTDGSSRGRLFQRLHNM